MERDGSNSNPPRYIVPANNRRHGDGKHDAVEDIVEDTLDGHVDGCELQLANGVNHILTGFHLFQQQHSLLNRIRQEGRVSYVTIEDVVHQRDDERGEKVNQDTELPSMEETDVPADVRTVTLRQEISDERDGQRHTPINEREERHGNTQDEKQIFDNPVDAQAKAVAHGAR